MRGNGGGFLPPAGITTPRLLPCKLQADDDDQVAATAMAQPAGTRRAGRLKPSVFSNRFQTCGEGGTSIIGAYLGESCFASGAGAARRAFLAKRA
jgi:hypothetical protein